MAGVTASGLGSGIDIGGLVAQLVAAERQPADLRFARIEGRAQLQITALGSLRAALSDLRSAVDKLQSLETFSARRASSSKADLFTASAASGAALGRYSIEVVSLAAAHKLASGAFAGAGTVVGTGDLTLSVGGDAFTVTINDGNKTLGGIRDAINAASGNTGVSAALINESGGTRLILTAADTGAANVIAVTRSGGDGGLDALVYDPGTLTNLTGLTPAADAQVKVEGYAYASASNSVAGAIDGVTLSLLKAEPGTVGTLTIAASTQAVTDAVREFTVAYSNTLKTLKDLTAYDAEKKEGGPLLGDALARGVQAQLQSIVGSMLPAGAGIRSLAGIGVKGTASGGLELDAAKLTAALESGAGAVQSFFNGSGGLARRLDAALGNYVDASGQIQSKTDGLTATISRVNEQRESLERRMALFEERTRKQYIALDGLVSKLRSTADFLTQQLASLPRQRG